LLLIIGFLFLALLAVHRGDATLWPGSVNSSVPDVPGGHVAARPVEIHALRELSKSRHSTAIPVTSPATSSIGIEWLGSEVGADAETARLRRSRAGERSTARRRCAQPTTLSKTSLNASVELGWV
jgi:hypothetical protein